MKKIHVPILILFLLLIISGCNRKDLPLEEHVHNPNTSAIYENTDTSTEVPYQFMLDGKLYVDTGETENIARCGVMDENFTKVIPPNQIPSINGEVNFSSEPNGAQYGTRENRRITYVDGQWKVFAYNENNLTGVSMTVTAASPTKLTLQYKNLRKQDLLYGEWFTLESYQTDKKEWYPAETLFEGGFHEIGYILEADSTSEQVVDFEWLYGTLKPGRYRIVKDIIDSREAGDYEKYWLMAEFTIE